MHGIADKAIFAILMVMCAGFPALIVVSPVSGQNRATQDLIDRPISEIRIEGLRRVSRQMVLNNLRTAIGDPLDPETISNDVKRLARLGEFKNIDAEVELLEDGSVAVIYQIIEQAIIADVQVVGNSLISDEELRGSISVLPGGPRDDSHINNGKRAIENLYRQRGHYLTTVSIDQVELEQRDVVRYVIREGPRVRVKAVEFRGENAFDPRLLMAEIKTKPQMFLLRKGELNEKVILEDVIALDRFYKSRGFLDVRIDRQIELSPNNREAKVVFLIDEGRQYRLGRLRARRQEDGGPLRVFAPEQLAALLEINSGDVFRADLLIKSVKTVREAYGNMGYLDVDVRSRELHSSSEPVVDLLLEISEGRSYKVGLVQVNGNFLTRDKVIRRQIRLEPGRPYNANEVEKSRRKLQRTRLFNDVRFTVLEPDEVDPEYRDLLVEIKERNTGSLNFGFAVGSDSGLFGEFSYAQNNFDVSDTPESLEELIRGRAFRGGGQRFSMTLRPGSEFFQYVISLTEPNLFDSDYTFNISGAFRSRIFEDYDEDRLNSQVRLGRQFGDVWSGALRMRAGTVELTNIDADAPTEVFLDAGPDTLTSIGFDILRTTIETLNRPGRGSRLELGFDWYGAMGGDIDFQRVTAEYTLLLTMTEDFLGRKSILRLTSKAGYLFGDRAPTYERFYLGGRTFRGFDFRSVSPKGIRADTLTLGTDPVGGTWQFFLGAQYEIPIFQEAMTGVVFVDSGTVTEDPGFDEYRISVGLGLRLYIPALGQWPLAFDFATALQKEDGDETQVFSFTAELPF